jgi:hypothetical protein
VRRWVGAETLTRSERWLALSAGWGKAESMARIYISSTYRDLKECRKEVYRTLRQMKHDVIAMEDYVATDERPLDRCLADVDACDLYVGIIAWRYGYIPLKNNPARKSITELEYRRAASKGKPCLLFLLGPRATWPEAEIDDGALRTCIADFRRELEKDRLVSYFQNADQLAKLVSIAVAQWERSQLTPQARGWRSRCQEWLAATVFARRNTKRYLRNLVAQHREFTFLGRAKPLDLEHIYVSLRVAEHTPRALRPDLPTATNPDASLVAGRLVEIPEALSLCRHLAVLGDPGSGKTTLLKYLALQLARSDARLGPFARNLIPTPMTRLLGRLDRALSRWNFELLARILAYTALIPFLIDYLRAADHGLLAALQPPLWAALHPHTPPPFALKVIWSGFCFCAILLSLFICQLTPRSAFRLFAGSGCAVIVIYLQRFSLLSPFSTAPLPASICLATYSSWVHLLLTLLRLFLQSITQYPIPIYLTLNDLARHQQSIDFHMVDSLSRLGFPNPRHFFTGKLDRGHCMIFLDGLDEVVNNTARRAVLAEIHNLHNAYGGQNAILLTSRIAGFEYTINGYLQLEVQEFDSVQTIQFIDS